jgi:L-seryl-tRNA(Ser) seleniumtransferase
LLPRRIVVAIIRQELSLLRRGGAIPPETEIVEGIRRVLATAMRSRLQPVVNATGIIVHTNLGRIPMGKVVADALVQLAMDYSNLEMDLETGRRGGRAGYLEHGLALLCEAEAATVTNNCAAALVLILRHLTSGRRKEVIISRGELIQIGGGFRIPEILEATGAKLREVGTTNRTTVADYAQAIGAETALLLKVHHSNFFMEGFVEAAPHSEIAALARRHRLPLIEDLGSGAVLDTARLASLQHEPSPGESLRNGSDLVCFSGDKLFGGPQAGIIAGKRRLVEKLRKEPFFRALRCDKLVLAALQATVEQYLANQLEEIPLVAMIRLPGTELRRRAGNIAERLASSPVDVRVIESEARIGGGSLPRSVLPSIALHLKPHSGSAADLAVRLRQGDPPVIGHLAAGGLQLDLRTVIPGQDETLLRAVRSAIAGAGRRIVGQSAP